MKKLSGITLSILFLFQTVVFAQENIAAFENKLGYGAQMQENLNRGTKEIVEAPKQIPPSFKEEEHTKLNVPALPQADDAEGCLLAVINVADSLCRGVWRILVAPLPFLQKVQP